MLRGGGAAEAEDAVVDGERAVDAVAASEGEGACAGLGEGPCIHIAAEGGGDAYIATDIDDTLAGTGGGGIDGKGEV